MKKYTVICHYPSEPLTIEMDDLVEVEGWLEKGNIRVAKITNLNREELEFQCGTPIAAEFTPGFPKWVIKKGVVTKVIIGSKFIQFDIKTDE